MRKMTKIFAAFLMLLQFVGCSAPEVESGAAKGHLLIVGGGIRSDKVMSKMGEYASKHGSGKIIVIPNASATPLRTGPGQASQIAALCENEVTWINVTTENVNRDSTLGIFENAGGVWFSGGSQTRLTTLLNGTKLLEKIRDIYTNGGIIGGSSAGAAIMSEIMITGKEKRPVSEDKSFQSIEGDNIGTTEGFGFIKNVIIDQHFVKRQRENRLISLVIENPDYIGIGIDEQTAIFYKPDNSFEVMGNSNVLIFDATEAKTDPYLPEKSHALSASDIKFHVLTAGQIYDLKTRKVYK